PCSPPCPYTTLFRSIEPLSDAGWRVAIRFPFWNEPNPLPFQAIARAAGLAPSLLGLDLHPRYGPWIAYRALVLTDREIPETPIEDRKSTRLNSSHVK